MWGDTGVFIGMTILENLIGSALWAVGGVAVMLVYMMLHTKSPLCTLGGLGLINLAIPITIFIYTVIFRIGYFGMFNFLSFFLIMGIGVDDIFVFYDAWLQSAQHHRTLEARLDYAYRRSAHAMAVTSFTDAAAFYTNCLLVDHRRQALRRLHGHVGPRQLLSRRHGLPRPHRGALPPRPRRHRRRRPDLGLPLLPARRALAVALHVLRSRSRSAEAFDGAEVPAAAEEGATDATSSTQGGGADGGRRRGRSARRRGPIESPPSSAACGSTG